jgi:hypothetical protein
MTTTRRRNRHNRYHPALLAAGLVLALVVADEALHILGWLVLTAAITAGAYALGHHRQGPARARPVVVPDASPRLADAEAERDQLRGQVARLTAERDQLGARVGGLTRQVAEARDAAHAAWDAAASITTRPAPDDDTGGKRAALLIDPLSGARPLVGR